MSFFTLRPEEPSEMAGVPSEPERDSTAAELLPTTTTDAAAVDLPGVTSIAIPMPTPPAASE
jgi:hypothetical protein